MDSQQLSRREYQGSTSLTYHLTYGKASYNITMAWLSSRNGYEIEAVSNCNNNCTNPKFPYRVTRWDIHKIEELENKEV